MSMQKKPRKTAKKITQEERIAIKQMREGGAPLKEIANRFDITISAASYIFRDYKKGRKSSISKVQQRPTRKRAISLQPGKVIGFLEWVDQRAAGQGIGTAFVVESVFAYLANGGDVPSQQEILLLTEA